MSTINIDHSGGFLAHNNAPDASKPKGALQNIAVWKTYQKVLFRIAFVFFIFMSVPSSWSWYENALSLDWFHLHYRDLYDIARFGSGLSIFGNQIFGSPLNGYAVWIITLIFSTGLGLLWTAIEFLTKTEAKAYNLLYYWLKVVVRYRAGIGIIGFGFTKLLPTQLPYPSFGVLNTNFGDLTLQKVYWLSIGISPWYEVFTGIVEVAAGALLFFRATTFWGAMLLFGALADIVYVNLAYDGGVHVYSSYFVLLSGFLLIDYIPRIYRLLIKEEFTVPAIYYPSFPKSWQQYTRYALKGATLFIFLGVLFYLQLVNFWYDPYKQPALKGISELRGNYQVSEFRLNNQVIPFSPQDTQRWQQATFEKWTTLTFKVNKPIDLDLSNGGGAPMRDINRTFELTGVAGGQRVFYYEADTVNKVLYLQDKNRGSRNRENREFRGNNQARANSASGNNDSAPSRKKGKSEGKNAKEEQWIPKEALANIGPEDPKINPIARSTRRTKGIEEESKGGGKRHRMILKYEVSKGGQRVVLSGINENKDSIHVVLDRYNKKYLLPESTLKAGSY